MTLQNKIVCQMYKGFLTSQTTELAQDNTHGPWMPCSRLCAILMVATI